MPKPLCGFLQPAPVTLTPRAFSGAPGRGVDAPGSNLQPKMDRSCWINAQVPLPSGVCIIQSSVALSPVPTAVAYSLLHLNWLPSHPLLSPPFPSQCFLGSSLKLLALKSLLQGPLLGETQPKTHVPKLPGLFSSHHIPPSRGWEGAHRLHGSASSQSVVSDRSLHPISCAHSMACWLVGLLCPIPFLPSS